MRPGTTTLIDFVTICVLAISEEREFFVCRVRRVCCPSTTSLAGCVAQIELGTFQLPDVVVPSPLIFLKQKNLIAIQTTNLQIRAYKYNNIYGNTGGGATGVKPEWESVVGENALSFDLCYSGDDTQLIVGCEQHIYALKAISGKLEHMKKLQCVPSCVLVNSLKADIKESVMIVSSFSHHILFYKNYELVWATK